MAAANELECQTWIFFICFIDLGFNTRNNIPLTTNYLISNLFLKRWHTSTKPFAPVINILIFLYRKILIFSNQYRNFLIIHHDIKFQKHIHALYTYYQS